MTNSTTSLAGRAHRKPRTLTLQLSALPCGALLVDSSGRIAAANARVSKIFGEARRALRGREISALIPGWTTQSAGKRRIECSAQRADGSRFTLRYSRSPVLSDGDAFTLVAVMDVTRRKANEIAVRDSVYGFRQLAEALPQMLWTTRPDGAAEFVSRRMTDYTGVPAEQHLREGWLNLAHPEDRDRIGAEWKKAVAESRTFHGEFRVRRHDGQFRWCESNAVPVRDREGNVVRWFGLNTDVHDAREMRMALLEERDRFSMVVASAPGAIYAFRIDANGAMSFPFASAGIGDLFGVTFEELSRSAEPAWARVHPDDVGRMLESITRSAQTLTPWRAEWRVLNPRRGEIWVEGRSVPTREQDGSTLWYGIIIDISERKRADEELRRSQARLQAAVMASGIGTWIWDVDANHIWWDDALLKMFDRSREEIERGGIEGAAEFVHPEDRAAVGRAIATARSGRTDGMTLEYRTVRRDGALQWIAVNGRVDRDASGRMVRITGACMDITARRRVEESQRNSQKVEALGTLAGGIAHDFNNILLAITGNARLAMVDLPADHPVRGNLMEIDKASARATDLVQRILAFGRQSEPRREVMQLRPTIEEAVKLLRASLPAMIEIRSSFEANLPSVNADSTQIHQVIMNLITNSAHAIGDEAGVVTVSLDAVNVHDSNSELRQLRPGTYVRLTVSDTGAGMDEATQARIFDPFFTTKPAGQGTGLGLSVVHGIMRSHEGAITVDSAPGQGAAFHLYFPAARPVLRDAPEAPREAVKGRGQRIMYVDDEEALVYLTTRMLQRLGYQVSGFTDPGKALQAFQQSPAGYDVVVTDLSMPGMSGFHFARALLDVRADIAVLMTSGYVRPQDRETARELGVRDLILKPDTIEELGHSLARLFEKIE
ncbi:MAG: PAS domain-containing protein [Steroidobacter sp.]